MITTLDLKKIGIKTAYSYIEKNPEKNHAQADGLGGPFCWQRSGQL